MDIVWLPDKWRREAARLPKDLDAGIVIALRRCANELELAYHQDSHDGEFYSGCRFCDWEREHNDRYPEGINSGSLKL